MRDLVNEANGNDIKDGRRVRRAPRSFSATPAINKYNANCEFKEGIFTSRRELNVFRLLDPANLWSYVRLKYAFKDSSTEWIRTNRTELFAILGHANIRSVYNILHRFRKRGILEVRFQGNKGILIRFSLIEASGPGSMTHHLVLRPGATVFIQTEGALCI